MAKLDKKLTLYGLTMIAIGSCIGSGIFRTPNGVMAEVQHHGLALLAWALGGLIALTGALTFAELGGLFPKAGGVYVYLKEAYGKLVGFLYGWAILLVITTGALAALSVVFVEYLEVLIPALQGNDHLKLLLAAITILGLTGINIIGVSLSQLLASISSTFKLSALALIIILGFYYYEPQAVNIQLFEPNADIPENYISALFLALVGVLWSIGGWHHASYLAGETKNAQRTIPRAMMLGVTIVTVVYILANLAYMMILPKEQLLQSEAIVSDLLQAIFGANGAYFAAIIIAISIFGTIGIYTMSAPRIYFSMAKDGVFFNFLAKVHPRFKTPANAMIIQAIWAVVLLLFWGSFSDLISFVTLMDIAFMALAGASVFVFRKKMPDAPRLYRTFGYPIVPAIFVIISTIFVVVNVVMGRQKDADLVNQSAFVSGALLLVGVGVYFLYQKYKSKATS